MKGQQACAEGWASKRNVLLFLSCQWLRWSATDKATYLGFLEVPLVALEVGGEIARAVALDLPLDKVQVKEDPPELLPHVRLVQVVSQVPVQVATLAGDLGGMPLAQQRLHEAAVEILRQKRRQLLLRKSLFVSLRNASLDS